MGRAAEDDRQRRIGRIDGHREVARRCPPATPPSAARLEVDRRDVLGIGDIDKGAGPVTVN